MNNPGYKFLLVFLPVLVLIIIVGLFFKNMAVDIKSEKEKAVDIPVKTVKTFDAYPFQAGQWITSKTITQADLQGKPYVLEFWATWCPPCRVSIPHMIELNEKYSDKITFIGLSGDDSVEPVKKMVAAMGINYNVAMDDGLAEKYGVKYIPTAFVIDSDSKIVWKGSPLDKAFDKAIEKLLEPLSSGGQENDANKMVEK